MKILQRIFAVVFLIIIALTAGYLVYTINHLPKEAIDAVEEILAY